MKIAFLSTFFPFRGGIAQFNANLFRILEKENQVKAFTFKRQYPQFLFPGETQYVTENDEVDKIPSDEVLDTINPFSYQKTARKIAAFQPDVLIMKYWMTFFAPSLGFVSKKLKRAKRICILDNLIPHEKRFFDKSFNAYFTKQIDGFVVMSDKVLEDLLKTKPDANYIRIDHPLYDHFGAVLSKEVACRNLGLDTQKKYVLFFGFIRDYKGLDLLIEAFKTVDDQYELIVAGEVYGSFDKYAKLIEKNQLTKRIHLFNRYISDHEVPSFFSASEVCVLPYKSATQSGITAISYHFNLPIIATDVGGLKETISDGKTGVIVKEINKTAFSQAINRYLRDDLKSQFAPHIQAYKSENSWESFSEKMLDFINKIEK